MATQSSEPETANREKEIVLTLGDVIARIPAKFLATGELDPAREIRFQIDEIAADIARGKATMPLSKIASACPDLFRGKITPSDDIEVMFPWQKVVGQIGKLRDRREAAPSETKQPATPAKPIRKERFGVVNWFSKFQSAEAPKNPSAADLPLPSSAADRSEARKETPAAPLPAIQGEIGLSLAAILAGLPKDYLAKHPETVDESLCIFLPLQSVEPQLPTGKVEIPAAVFLAALPAEHRALFFPNESRKFPIPLTEVFLHLPDAKAASRPEGIRERVALQQLATASVKASQQPADKAVEELTTRLTEATRQIELLIQKRDEAVKERDDISGRLNALSSEREALIVERDKALAQAADTENKSREQAAAGFSDRAEILKEKDRELAKLSASLEEFKKQIDALNVERQSAVRERDALAAQIAQLRKPTSRKSRS